MSDACVGEAKGENEDRRKKLDISQHHCLEQPQENQMEEQGQQDQNENKTDKDVNELKQSQDTSKTEPGVSLVAEKKKHTCTKCFKTFDTFYSLKCHRLSCRKIDKKYKCSHCGMSFGQAMHLQVSVWIFICT